MTERAPPSRGARFRVNPRRRMTPAALVALMIVGGVGLSSAPASQDKKPNILFILVDNIGYGDIGVYGGGELRGAPTPRIDQLASEGLRLTQFLVEPGCRSEEHTSELQSQSNLVCRLLLEKKKTTCASHIMERAY